MVQISQGELDQFIRQAQVQTTAEIGESTNDRPFTMQKIVVALDTAATESNPYEIRVPFRGLFVRDATDSITEVKINFHSRDLQQIQNAIALKINDSFELPRAVGSAFLTWDAQAGKTMTIYIFLDGNFRTGSQLSITSGGVSISEGSALETTNFTITAGTQTLLFDANSSRKLGTYVNETGANQWYGGASVDKTGANKGILLPPGSTLYYRNTAALYLYSDATYTDASKMEES